MIRRRRMWAPAGVLTLALLAATACGSGSEESVVSVDSVETVAPASTTTAVATTEPEVVAAGPDTAELTAEIESAVTEWMAASGAPAVTAAVILPDGTEITVAEGVSDAREGTAVTSDDYFRFASITKPMTSAIILQLVEEGLVELDRPVADYLGDEWITGYVLDGVDYGPLVTVRQILDHTDGFAEFAFDPGFYLLMSPRLDVPVEPAEIVAWAGSVGPQFVPGTAYNYNTVGHVVAGLIIEEVTGLTASEVMRQRLFEPAGVEAAYLTPQEYPPVDTVDGYIRGALRDAVLLLPSVAPLAESATVGEYLDITAVPQGVLRSAGWTGGGLEATALSTARIFASLFDGTALDPETVAAFTTPWDGSDAGYGLGISVGTTAGQPSFSHGGGVPGFRSDAVYLPDLGLTVVVSANLVEVDPDIGVLSSSIVERLIDDL